MNANAECRASALPLSNSQASARLFWVFVLRCVSLKCAAPTSTNVRDGCGGNLGLRTSKHHGSHIANGPGPTSPPVFGRFCWQFGPRNFQSPRRLLSCKRAGPNIAPDIGGIFAGTFAPKTSKDLNTHINIPNCAVDPETGS